jgi:uncharacterized protein (DUF2147 family)
MKVEERRMRIFKLTQAAAAFFIAAIFFCGHSAGAQAAGDSPVGLWRIIDDQTGKAQGIMKIYETSPGMIAGRLEQTFDPTDVSKVCTECEDDRKDKPLIGLELMRGLKKTGDEYNGGTILDPESGDDYGCTVKVTEGGQKLLVRGFLGISLLGRTQTWIREK